LRARNDRIVEGKIQRKEMNMKKQTLYWIFGAVVVTLACALGTGIPTTSTTQPPPQVDEVGTAVAATMQALTPASSETAATQPPTEAPTQLSGIPVSFEYASFVIPNGLASGATPELVPAVGEDGGAPWEVAPAHLKFTLTGYPLQNKVHTPTIFMYPVEEYSVVNPGAADQIKRTALITLGSPLERDTLPGIPFFNAGPLFAANMQLMKFQNGMGVRALTQYAQYSAPINNRELFYLFEGLTGYYNNNYYIIAILPITAPVLQEDETPQALLPAEGVPFPADGFADESYYFSVTEKLNSLPTDSYTPALNTLDSLIESILVTNP